MIDERRTAVNFQPGIYQHYKGGKYRALFLTKYIGDPIEPADSAPLSVCLQPDGTVVALEQDKQHLLIGNILVALWSGNEGASVHHGDLLTIYASLENGRIAARPWKEFGGRTMLADRTTPRRFAFLTPALEGGEEKCPYAIVTRADGRPCCSNATLWLPREKCDCSCHW
jgi:hypothetical protein